MLFEERTKIGLEGKCVVITGAARGIGEAIASSFAQEGSWIVLADINFDMGNQAAKEIQQMYGVKVLSFKVDVANKRSVQQMVTHVMKLFGRIDVLVNNAGVASMGCAENCSEQEWDRVMDINLKGPLLCSQACAKVMMKHQGGSIISISSIQSEAAFPGRVAYNVSKAGINMLTKTLAIEWAKHGIRVNAVAPGFTMTEMNKELMAKKLFTEEEIVGRTPLRRMASPHEIADMCVFLASDRASFITGAIFFIDGGWMAWGYI